MNEPLKQYDNSSALHQTVLLNQNMRALFRRAVNALSLTAVVYVVLVDLYVALHYTLGERLTPVGVLNNVAPWVLGSVIPASLIIALSPKRRWVRLLMTLPALAALIAWYGMNFLPKSTPAVANRVFTVATYNATAQIDDLDHVPQRARAILALNADLIGVQEFGFPERYLPLLREQYPYHYTHEDTTRRMPYALFSRFPIDKDATTWIGDMTELNHPAATRFLVFVDEQPIAVYVMHAQRPEINLRSLRYDASARSAGVREVIASLENEEIPVIVLCDCNGGDRTDDYAALERLLTDAWQAQGWGLGFTVPATVSRSPFPIMRGDYIWHSGELLTLSIAVAQDSGGSDHFPVLAQMALVEAQNGE